MRYRTLICHAEPDKPWAQWLERRLTRYRTPRRLIGQPSRDGVVPSNVRPVWRCSPPATDGALITEELAANLEQSLYLVIVCSPHAATSLSISEVIRRFKALGHEDHVLPLIVAGEPNAIDKPDCGLPECFPAALQYRVDEAGMLSSERAEPIAADLRPGRDSKGDAVLRIAAGLLGVGFEDLKQRAARARLYRRLTVAVFAVAVIAIGIGIWQRGEWQRNRESAQQRAARNQERGRLASLEGRFELALAYLGDAYQSSDSAGLRFLLAEASRHALPLLTLSSDAGQVLEAHFSPDDRLIVTASTDATAKLWDSESGQLIHTLVGHTNQVKAASFTPDGRRVVTASEDGSAMIWNVETGKPEIKLSGIACGNVLAIDPSGRRIVTGCSGGQASGTRVWDTSTGQASFSLKGYEGMLFSATFSPNGERLATSGEDTTARIWDAEHGTLLATLSGHDRSVGTVRYSSDGRQIITAGGDGTARVWDADSFQLKSTHRLHSRALGAQFSPDAARFITLHEGRVRVWDTATGESLGTLARGEGFYLALPSFDPAGTLAVTPSPYGKIQIGFALTATPLTSVKTGDGTSWWAEFNRDGSRFVAASGDGNSTVWQTPRATLMVDDEARANAVGLAMVSLSPRGDRAVTLDDLGWPTLWDANTGRRVNRLARGAGQSAAQFRADGARLVTLGDDGKVRLWDSTDGSLVKVIASSSTAATAFRVSPNGECILIGNADGSLERWSGSGDSRVSVKPEHDGPILSITLSRDRRLLATTGADGTIRITDTGRDVETTRTLKGHRGAVQAAAFNRAATRLVSGGADGTTRLWDVESGEQTAVFDGHGAAVLATAFCAEERRIVAASKDEVTIWDLDNSTARAKIEGRVAPNGTFVSSDGERIAVVKPAGAAEIWDASDGLQLARLEVHGDRVSSLTFSEDGERVLSSGEDGTALIVDAGLEKRTPAHITDAVRCHIPYRIDGEQLLPTPRDPSACARQRSLGL